MSEDKSGKAKVTIEVEVNEALMAAAKEWKPMMGWMGPVEGPRYDGWTNALGSAWGHGIRNAMSSMWRTHG